MLIAVSAATDAAGRRIYNWVTYPAVAWALAINVAQTVCESTGVEPLLPLGGVGLSTSLAGMAVCFFVVMFAYNLSGGGAGDVKLAAGIGVLLGPELGVFAVAYAYIFAGATMVAVLAWERGPMAILASFGRWIGSALLPMMVPSPTDEDRQLLNRPVPLGPYFALGTLFVTL